MPVDMYMLVDGIPGESTDADHEQWIKLQNFSHGVSQPVSGVGGTGGLTGGHANFQDFSVVKIIDSATPDLNIKCANGTPISKVEVELCLTTGDKHTFMKYTMEDCIVTSVAPGGTSTDEIKPLENVSFAYGQLKWEYTPIDNDGIPGGATTERCWNLEQHTTC